MEGVIRRSFHTGEKCVQKKIYCCVFNKISGKHTKNAADILHAVRRGFVVVKSCYIFYTFEKGQRLWPSQYKQELKGLQSKYPSDFVTARKHFTKSKTLKSIMKPPTP